MVMNSPPDIVPTRPAGHSELSQGTQLSRWNTVLGHCWQLSSLALWQSVHPAPEEFQFPVLKFPSCADSHRVEVVRSQALSLVWQCRGEVPRCPSSLNMGVRSRNHFIFTERFSLLLQAFPFLSLLFYFFFSLRWHLRTKPWWSGPVATQPWQKTEKSRWRREKLSALHNFAWHLFTTRRKVGSLSLILPTPPPRFNSQALSAWSCFTCTHLSANLDGCHIITGGQNSRASNGDNKLNLVWEISVFLLSCRSNFISH